MDQKLPSRARAELNRMILTPVRGKGSAMMLKSLPGVCSTLLHVLALVSGALSIYFFFGPAIELIMVALIMLGAAAAFEVIAAIVGEGRVAHY